MRNFITVDKRKGNEELVSGTGFSHLDFYGVKRDKRNKLGDTHSIDEQLVTLVYEIQSFINITYPDVKVVITSSSRTAAFNRKISTTGASGVHVKNIAVDFVFTGENAFAAWCLLKNEIQQKTLQFQLLLTFGLGGVGIYGKRDSASYFFHIDTRQEGDGFPRSERIESYQYAMWEEGDLSCENTPVHTNDEEEITLNERKRGNRSSSGAEEFVRYVYQKTDDISLEDLVNSNSFIGKDLSAKDIREVEKDGVSNNKRLFENLTIEEKREYGGVSYSSSRSYPVTTGGVLYIPLRLIDKRVTYESNFTSTMKSYNDFFPPLVRKITTDPGYVPAYLSNNSTKQIRPHLRVYLWSKALYLSQHDSNGFIDISSHIIQINADNSIEGGGDFQFQISPVSYDIIQEEGRTSVSVHREGTVSRSSINYSRDFSSEGESRSEHRRRVPYYRRVIGKSDMIFIAFEKLEIDGRIEENVDGKWYDMIGLIDHVEHDTNPAYDSNVVIRGRSLIGVLMDDNSYFNPVSIGHQASFFGGDPLSNGRYLNGGFSELSSTLARSIRENIEFIFHRIATIGYVPDDVFKIFKSRTEISKYSKKTEDGTVEEEITVKGVWQLMKMFIDSSIDSLRIADSSISNPQGSILDLINKVCQYPFVEFFTDTYGDKFYLIARKPPFEQDSLIKAVFEVSEHTDGDLSPSQSSGSLDREASSESNLNRYIEHVDDYKRNSSDQKETLLGGINDLEEVVITTTVFPRIVNVSESDVHQDSLKLSSQGYAWYQLEEQGNFLGKKMGIGMVPSIYFDEIAQVFGNRRLTVTSNYTSLNFYLDKNINTNRNQYAEQISQQLTFLVETNLHLPFTREGQLTLNPDRRIKVGNYIYYRPTREIFYVTAVSNEMFITGSSIERATIVTVERGMKIDFIKGARRTIYDEDGVEKEIEISYFNLTDLQQLRSTVYDVVAKENAYQKFDYKSSISINTDVLNFFLQNRQFDEE